MAPSGISDRDIAQATHSAETAMAEIEQSHDELVNRIMELEDENEMLRGQLYPEGSENASRPSVDQQAHAWQKVHRHACECGLLRFVGSLRGGSCQRLIEWITELTK